MLVFLWFFSFPNVFFLFSFFLLLFFFFQIQRCKLFFYLIFFERVTDTAIKIIGLNLLFSRANTLLYVFRNSVYC